MQWILFASAQFDGRVGEDGATRKFPSRGELFVMRSRVRK
jgi:hypothetical protein